MGARGLLLPVLAVLAAASPVPSQTPAAGPTAKTVRPKPTPPPAPVLEGVVRGPDKKPIEKALVAALAWRGMGPLGPGPLTPIVTRTDAQGRFRLVLKTREPQTVRVDAAGLAARTLKDVAPGTPLTIDLAPGGRIEGTVRDGDTGQPVADARVEAAARGAFDIPDHAGAGRVAARSDAGGRFVLEGVGVGLHTVSGRGRGGGYGTKSNVRVGTKVDLLLLPAASVVGTVTGPDGKPLAGALVQAARERRRGFALHPEPTDAQGRFELAGLQPGRYDVIATAPDLAPAVAPNVILERRSEARVDLALRAGVRVTGRLIDARDQPSTGRVTVGELDGEATPSPLADRMSAEAGANGRFTIDGVPTGEHAIAVYAPGQAPQRVDFAARAGSRVVDLGDVRLEAGLVIRGRVRTAAGQPVAEAGVMGLPTQMRTGELPEARTDAEGAFALAGLQQIPYRVVVSAPGFGPAEKTAEPGGPVVDIALDPAGVIRGLVVDDRSQPIETFTVVARAVEERRFRRAPRMEEVTSSDGRFSLGDLAEGAYTLVVSSPERASQTVSGVKVAAGAEADVGTVKLSAGGVVRGTVVDDGGAFVAGARVTVRGQGRDWFSFGNEPQATTDLSGAFEVRGVAAGSAQATASHPSFAASEPAPVDVDPAKAPADVRLVLSQGGRVAGSVRRRDGSPITGMNIRVNPGARRGMFSFDDQYSSPTLPDGTFAIEHVPAGHAQLMLMPPLEGGSGPMSSQMRDIEVRAGETTTVDIVNRDILLSGRATRAGTPAAGLRLQAHGSGRFSFAGPQGMPQGPSSGPQRMNAVTREDGGFEMLVDEPGKITIEATTPDGRVRLPGRPVEVPDADAHSVELNYAGVPVAGIVVDKDTEAPLAFANVFARTKEPGRGSAGTAGPDGRFQLEVEPGDYRIGATVREEGYGPGETEVSVGSSGVTDVRVALPKGVAIAGRVTDAGGRPVAGVQVFAQPPNTSGPEWGWADSLADGTFTITGLKEDTFVLTARSDAGLFAVQPGVRGGARNVTLVVRPGGRLEITVVGPDDAAVAGAWPQVSQVNGIPVRMMGGAGRATDAEGSTELMVPAGDLMVTVRHEKQSGGEAVSVGSGETAALRIKLRGDSTPAP